VMAVRREAGMRAALAESAVLAICATDAEGVALQAARVAATVSRALSRIS
jgi:hypothetical protein